MVFHWIFAVTSFIVWRYDRNCHLQPLVKARSVAALTKRYTLRTLQHFKETHLLWISALERLEGDHCVFMFSSLSSDNAHWAVCVLWHISPRFDLCCSYSRTALSVTFFCDIFANSRGCFRQGFKTFTCRPLHHWINIVIGCYSLFFCFLYLKFTSQKTHQQFSNGNACCTKENHYC